MIGMQDENAVHGLLNHRIHFIVFCRDAKCHAQEVAGVGQAVVGIKEGLTDCIFIGHGSNGRHFCDQPVAGNHPLLGVIDVRAVMSDARVAGRLAIKRLAADVPVTPEKVDAFIEAHSFPIVEGPNVTFVFRGEAKGVRLRHWIYGLESSQPLERIPDTDVFYRIVELPPCSRVEYKLEIEHEDRSEWIQDPLNGRLAQDPFGANSVAHADGYEVPSWSQPDEDVRPGRLEPFHLHSEALGGERGGHLYFPARYRTSRRYPLLVVHDGTDYLRYAGMKTVLDNLIHALEIPDLIACFVDSPERLVEYAAHEPHARFISEELTPHLERTLPIEARPASRCLMGASFGGVAALSTAWRYPDFWGRLLLQSGSFAFTDIGHGNHRGPVFDPVVE